MSIRIVKRNASEVQVDQTAADETKAAARIRRKMVSKVLSWIREQSRQRELALSKARSNVLFTAPQAEDQERDS